MSYENTNQNYYYNPYYSANTYGYTPSTYVSDRRIFTSPSTRSKSGSKSGYGSHGSYSSGHGSDCCPLVVDPLTLLSLGAFLAAAVYLLNELIAMSMLMMRRRKRDLISLDQIPNLLYEGKIFINKQLTCEKSLCL